MIRPSGQSSHAEISLEIMAEYYGGPLGVPRRKAKQALSLIEGKHPRESQEPPDVNALMFSWRVGSADMDGNWGWANIEITLLFSDIIPKLHNFETMKWGELKGPHHHFVRELMYVTARGKNMATSDRPTISGTNEPLRQETDPQPTCCGLRLRTEVLREGYFQILALVSPALAEIAYSEEHASEEKALP